MLWRRENQRIKAVVNLKEAKKVNLSEAFHVLGFDFFSLRRPSGRITERRGKSVNPFVSVQ